MNLSSVWVLDAAAVCQTGRLGTNEALLKYIWQGEEYEVFAQARKRKTLKNIEKPFW